jgi:hypothetical protein
VTTLRSVSLLLSAMVQLIQYSVDTSIWAPALLTLAVSVKAGPDMVGAELLTAAEPELFPSVAALMAGSGRSSSRAIKAKKAFPKRVFIFILPIEK